MSLPKILCLAALVLLCGPASAAKFKTLYAFCPEENCLDGKWPQGSLAMDSAGNLYGTTYNGGAGLQGVVFQLRPNAKRTKWRYRTIYTFCAHDASCRTGGLPEGRLIVDAAGNVYGTAQSGGHSGVRGGVAYELMPSDTGKKWKLKVLYSFGSHSGDGTQPLGGLTYSGAASGAVYDGISPLYGMTHAGGGADDGTAYALDPPASGGGDWSMRVLHSFCSATDCADGYFPNAGLTMDGSGNLFGVAGAGLFRLSPDGTQTILYTFCSEGECPDGSDPQGALTLDDAGNLYGTTRAGGQGFNSNAGVAFKLAPDGANWTYSVIHDFCSQRDCVDGMVPSSGLTRDSRGNLYGVTRDCLISPCYGTLYRIGATFSVLHTFTGDDGAQPIDNVIRDAGGSLYGVTMMGGAFSDAGTVYELRR
ncbi:MAG TPA: choice-of-anchor tandem repeat GloVer-containing protein [Rhizomicrobium sp.]|nr:choice-of-anchor tandem repeat GloVer-containing protein [Rhizomicrobium sp.]